MFCGLRSAPFLKSPRNLGLYNRKTNDKDYNLSSVIVRLGGCNTEISYIGAVGYTVEGSGFHELFSKMYAEASVPKILSGHEYSRAIRGHFLIQSVLIGYILSSMNFTTEEKNFTTSFK